VNRSGGLLTVYDVLAILAKKVIIYEKWYTGWIKGLEFPVQFHRQVFKTRWKYRCTVSGQYLKAIRQAYEKLQLLKVNTA